MNELACFIEAVRKSTELPAELRENAEQVKDELRNLVLSNQHIKPYTKALLDARVARVAKEAWDSVYAGKASEGPGPEKPEFDSVESDSRVLMQKAVQEDSWKSKCKGRALLKAYRSKCGIRYEHFRNLLINRIQDPPDSLSSIMDQILKN